MFIYAHVSRYCTDGPLQVRFNVSITRQRMHEPENRIASPVFGLYSFNARINSSLKELKT